MREGGAKERVHQQILNKSAAMSVGGGVTAPRSLKMLFPPLKTLRKGLSGEGLVISVDVCIPCFLRYAIYAYTAKV